MTCQLIKSGLIDYPTNSVRAEAEGCKSWDHFGCQVTHCLATRIPSSNLILCRQDGCIFQEQNWQSLCILFIDPNVKNQENKYYRYCFFFNLKKDKTQLNYTHKRFVQFVEKVPRRNKSVKSSLQSFVLGISCWMMMTSWDWPYITWEWAIS